MEVQYKSYRYNKERLNTESISDFLYGQLLFQGDHGDKIRLEDQPQKVCEALGRLVSKLVDKNILNLQDLKDIAQCSYGVEDTLEFKKDEDET